MKRALSVTVRDNFAKKRVIRYFARSRRRAATATASKESIRVVIPISDSDFLWDEAGAIAPTIVVNR